MTFWGDQRMENTTGTHHMPPDVTQVHTTAYEKCLPKKIKPKSIEVSNTKKY